MVLISILCAFFAFSILIMGAALAHHLNDYEDDESDCLCVCDAPNDVDEDGDCLICGWRVPVAGGAHV